MKEKFKKGMALVLATAMLIPSAVSAQTAVNRGNILKDMETKRPSVGIIKIEGDITYTEDTENKIKQKVGADTPNKQDNKLYKTSFDGKINYVSDGKKDNSDKVFADAKYKLDVKSNDPDILAKYNKSKVFQEGKMYMRGYDVFVPAEFALLSFENAIKESKKEGKNPQRLIKAYNDIRNGGYKYVKFKSQETEEVKKSQETEEVKKSAKRVQNNIDEEQLKKETKVFADELENTIYKDYKTTVPYKLTSDEYNITVNKEQLINEIVHFADYTLQKIEKIINLFANTYSKSINQSGMKDRVNEVKSEFKIDANQRKEMIDNLRATLNDALKDVKFNMSYNVKSIDKSKNLIFADFKINIALKSGEGINLRIRSAKQDSGSIKLENIDGKIYDITSVMKDVYNKRYSK